jgi:hypothetical protein
MLAADLRSRKRTANEMVEAWASQDTLANGADRIAGASLPKKIIGMNASPGSLVPRGTACLQDIIAEKMILTLVQCVCFHVLGHVKWQSSNIQDPTRPDHFYERKKALVKFKNNQKSLTDLSDLPSKNATATYKSEMGNKKREIQL